MSDENNYRRSAPVRTLAGAAADLIYDNVEGRPVDWRFEDRAAGWKHLQHADGKLLATVRVPPTSNYRDVFLFHQKFGLTPPEKPKLLDKDTLAFRKKLIEEEYNEFFQANIAGDLEKAADALVDLVYVAMGTAVMMGLPWQELWDEVQKKNMQKVRANHPSESKRGSTLDVIKPEGWTPPDHAPALKRYGWKP
jgi:predicted HAD superfamily Cof-like phosphohydrolase